MANGGTGSSALSCCGDDGDEGAEGVDGDEGVESVESGRDSGGGDAGCNMLSVALSVSGEVSAEARPMAVMKMIVDSVLERVEVRAGPEPAAMRKVVVCANCWSSLQARRHDDAWKQRIRRSVG